jgi:beta-glucosidase
MEKYLDKSLSFEERAKDLVSRMTLDEKASQLTYNSAAVKRLGIPAYNWWNEALHGVARAGTATVFPQAIGLAAMFDKEQLHTVAEVISTEGRAKYNAYSKEEDRDIYKGLTFWSPNVNIFRDPRWGRGQETYGEDPYLTGRLGVAFVKGIQGDDPKYLKAAACAKHFAVHSGPEANRHSFDARVSDKDLWETYLPAFEACVREADVEAVMGAYNRTNGEPCCAHSVLMEEILREKWGFKGHYVSDCWALTDFHEFHKVTKNAEESAALAMEKGCDVNCGVVYMYVLAAVEKGLISEELIDRAVIRLMTTRIRLGMFDEIPQYDEIPFTANDCAAHRKINLETARKTMTLLKNDGVLPLSKEKVKTLAVIGPNADSRLMLAGNYHGTASKYITPLEGFQQLLGDSVRILYSEGCHKFKDACEDLARPGDRISEAVICAKESDVAVVVLGLDETMEGEQFDQGNAYGSGDREKLGLPGQQLTLLQAVQATGTPTILVLCAGSAVEICWAEDHVNAIVDAWYPGAQGGLALAELLFGEYSPAGRLPVTFYKDAADLPDFEDYSMENRTYKFFKGEPLYPFGYGLSYTDFVYENLKAEKTTLRPGESLFVTVSLTNRGKMDGEEVVQCYIKDMEASTRVPLCSLCGFDRVFLKAGETKEITFEIPASAMAVVLEDGSRVVEPGDFTLYVGGSQPDPRSRALTGKEPLSLIFTVA